MAPSSLPMFQQRVEQQLQHLLASKIPKTSLLYDAMAYSLLLGGKRIRPYLVYAVGQLLGAKLEDLDAAATAIEAIHCYSLIHDDLPAMDDDALRRGKPTCHIAFNEATAILAGDALQALAFEALCDHAYIQVTPSRQLAMVKALARAAGASGMCAGQAIDLAHTNQQVALTTLEQMHRLKTGALIECTVQLAYYASPIDAPTVLADLRQFADALGLAFQVQDDILDIESDTETLGKPQGSDVKANKSTYPALLGLQGAKQKAQQLYHDAIAALQRLPYDTTELQHFAHYIIARKF
ncbi:(2E,6E)-farnesyl diphosphate synthase [Alishewanella tabrizica]|uniref:(2E,6E)-farnesyl diphosphate synthase n=1 Tax=Alishewanella tabrizica TaxID=671278 RepID=A0ABQ2WDX0_9ALTE|nr:(2E,6E)-farnesyl diphosphate synthase [Alishewanella tabrizica]GGW50524.1 (2E,6E)-farnesyl diphosphate synthase [Alishewanella tabrizica]